MRCKRNEDQCPVSDCTWKSKTIFEGDKGNELKFDESYHILCFTVTLAIFNRISWKYCHWKQSLFLGESIVATTAGVYLRVHAWTFARYVKTKSLRWYHGSVSVCLELVEKKRKERKNKDFLPFLSFSPSTKQSVNEILLWWFNWTFIHKLFPLFFLLGTSGKMHWWWRYYCY